MYYRTFVHQICIVFLTVSYKSKSVDIFLSLLTSRQTFWIVISEHDRQFIQVPAKRPSSLYPRPSSQDHVSREVHLFPRVGKSLP